MPFHFLNFLPDVDLRRLAGSVNAKDPPEDEQWVVTCVTLCELTTGMVLVRKSHSRHPTASQGGEITRGFLKAGPGGSVGAVAADLFSVLTPSAY